MFDFSKATDTKKYFEGILNELGDSKITGVYTVSPIWFNHGYFIYMQCDPIYIIFDNGKCIVVEYNDINCLKAEYREMTESERQVYDEEASMKGESSMKDLFNRTSNIYGNLGKVTHIEKSALPYGSLKRVEIKRVTEEYSAWVGSGIVDGIKPTEETFSEIKFIMKNGKNFIVCFDDPESDGYSLIWSEDADVEDIPV